MLYFYFKCACLILCTVSLICVHCLTDPVRVMRAVLVEIANDEAMRTNSDGTKLCLSYGEILSKQLSNPTDEDKAFADWLYKSLEDVVKRDRSEMWTQFHVLRSSKEFCMKWQQYMNYLNLKNEPLFYQHFTLILFEQILRATFKDDSHPSEMSSIEFTYEEENAIRYMAGYVIRKLKEKDHYVEFLVDSDKEYLES